MTLKGKIRKLSLKKIFLKLLSKEGGLGFKKTNFRSYILWPENGRKRNKINIQKILVHILTGNGFRPELHVTNKLGARKIL